MKHYMVKPKKANVGPEPREFFDKWSSFVSEFKDLWEREVRRMVKERKVAEKKAAQERVAQLRQQHNSSIDQERKSTTTTTGGDTTPTPKKVETKGAVTRV